MKSLAVFGDAHFAKKADDPIIKKHIKDGQMDFFAWADEEMKRRGIEDVLLTGDIHDTRNAINVEALVTTRRLMLGIFKDYKKHVILGNHDMYYENSYDITSLELFEGIPNLNIIRSGMQKIPLLGKNFYMVPWIIPEKEPEFIEFMKKMATYPDEVKRKNVLFGHFDTLGIDMEGGNPSRCGLDSNLFLEAAHLTISGHYHGKSETKRFGNTLLYVGSPYPLSFANSDQSHGFWIINEDLSYEFIENTVSPNFKTIWDTGDLDNLPDLSKSFVRLYVDRDKTPEEILKCILKVEGRNPLVLKRLPYKGVTKENFQGEEVRSANETLHMDINNLSEVYLNQREDELPALTYYKDPKEEILKRVKQFDLEVRK